MKICVCRHRKARKTWFFKENWPKNMVFYKNIGPWEPTSWKKNGFCVKMYQKRDPKMCQDEPRWRKGSPINQSIKRNAKRRPEKRNYIYKLPINRFRGPILYCR